MKLGIGLALFYTGAGILGFVTSEAGVSLDSWHLYVILGLYILSYNLGLMNNKKSEATDDFVEGYNPPPVNTNRPKPTPKPPPKKYF